MVCVRERDKGVLNTRCRGPLSKDPRAVLGLGRDQRAWCDLEQVGAHSKGAGKQLDTWMKATLKSVPTGEVRVP